MGQRSDQTEMGTHRLTGDSWCLLAVAAAAAASDEDGWDGLGGTGQELVRPRTSCVIHEVLYNQFNMLLYLKYTGS